MAEKKTERYYKKLIKKISKNYWVIAVIVLAILLILILISGGITGNVISKNEAEEKIIEFAKSQGADVEVIEVNDVGSLYEIIILVQGQQVPVYLTKDGKYFGQMNLIEPEESEIEQQTSQDIPKSDKPKVELFIMTHCPYGTQAEKGIIPVLELLENKIDGSIKFVHYFMHAPEEDETPKQVCIREEQADKWFDYLKCFLEDGDSERCLNKVGIDMAKLNSCLSNNAEAYYAEDSTLSENYGVGGSPTLVINGKIISSSRDSSGYLSTICSAFNNAPEECSIELSSASPSPGFGYSTGTDTGAQC